MEEEAPKVFLVPWLPETRLSFNSCDSERDMDNERAKDCFAIFAERKMSMWRVHC